MSQFRQSNGRNRITVTENGIKEFFSHIRDEDEESTINEHSQKLHLIPESTLTHRARIIMNRGPSNKARNTFAGLGMTVGKFTKNGRSKLNARFNNLLSKSRPKISKTPKLMDLVGSPSKHSPNTDSPRITRKILTLNVPSVNRSKEEISADYKRKIELLHIQRENFFRISQSKRSKLSTNRIQSRYSTLGSELDGMTKKIRDDYKKGLLSRFDFTDEKRRQFKPLVSRYNDLFRGSSEDRKKMARTTSGAFRRIRSSNQSHLIYH